MNKIVQKERLPLSVRKFLIEGLFNIDFYKYATGIIKLTVCQQDLLDKAYKEYGQGKPLEYITGKSDFFGLRLDIEQSVLIPRPETETLIEQALEFMPSTKTLTVLDVGSGSGNLAVSLGLHRPLYKVISTDIARNALLVAARNVSKYNLKQVFFINADCLGCFKESVFDAIISNPPYVESLFIDEDTCIEHEPRVALDGGPCGLLIIKRILDSAAGCLRKEGLVFLEIGYNQMEAVLEYAQDKGLKFIKSAKDYSGIDRVVILVKVN